MKTNYKKYATQLQNFEQQQLLRVLPSIPQNIILNLSSNDYLGLQYQSELKTQFYKTLEPDIAFSAASSRLLTGNHKYYHDFETLAAQAFQREACLLFNSGYHANIGILPALSTRKDLILADKLVHASIIDGLQLCTAKVIRYPHLDYKWLENYLHLHRNEFENVFIVTESLFSMDGDICNLKKLVTLKTKFNCMLYVDEAHAIGVRGYNGLGIAEEQNCIQEIDFIIGTLGKALFSIGAFIICDQIIKNYLINTCRTLIFTSALPPINVAWSTFVFKKVIEMKKEREKLKELIATYNLKTVTNKQSHIIAIIIGENEPTIKISEDLKNKGYLVMPIRHPTVPKGTSRLRLSLHAGIDKTNLESFCEALNTTLKIKNNG